MDRGDSLQSRLDSLLAQQLAERVENDAIANAEEKMEWSEHDVLRENGQQGWLIGMNEVMVALSAIASATEEARRCCYSNTIGLYRRCISVTFQG